MQAITIPPHECPLCGAKLEFYRKCDEYFLYSHDDNDSRFALRVEAYGFIETITPSHTSIYNSRTDTWKILDGGFDKIWGKITDKKMRPWRKKIFARDGYQCRACRNDKTLHCHHIRPKSEFDCVDESFSDTNLITLCEECHKIVHSYQLQRSIIESLNNADALALFDKRVGCLVLLNLMNDKRTIESIIDDYEIPH
jgi:hypothetical protein